MIVRRRRVSPRAAQTKTTEIPDETFVQLLEAEEKVVVVDDVDMVVTSRSPRQQNPLATSAGAGAFQPSLKGVGNGGCKDIALHVRRMISPH